MKNASFRIPIKTIAWPGCCWPWADLFLLVLVAPACANDMASSRRFLVPVIAVGGAVAAGAALSRAKGDVYTPPEHSLDEKLMIITGGTAGLGLEYVKRLATAGASVVLTSRTQVKGKAAVDEVKSYLKERGVDNDKVYSLQLDLDDLESVKSFSQRLVDDTPVGSQKINVLMNNAGVAAIPDRQLTKDGLERQFQSNHVGHFALTATLFRGLAPNARIINVSSMAYKIPHSGLPIDDLNGQKYYKAWYNYGVSKLANILFTKELQRRADQAGIAIKTFSLHPGLVDTDITHNMFGTERMEQLKTGQNLNPLVYGFWRILKLLMKTVQEGASTQIYLAAVSDDVVNEHGGDYFVDRKPTKLSGAAKDMDAAKKLWVASEEFSKTTFEL